MWLLLIILQNVDRNGSRKKGRIDDASFVQSLGTMMRCLFVLFSELLLQLARGYFFSNLIDSSWWSIVCSKPKAFIKIALSTRQASMHCAKKNNNQLPHMTVRLGVAVQTDACSWHAADKVSRAHSISQNKK